MSGGGAVFFNMGQRVAAHDDNRNQEGHNRNAKGSGVATQQVSNQVKTQKCYTQINAHSKNPFVACKAGAAGVLAGKAYCAEPAGFIHKSDSVTLLL